MRVVRRLMATFRTNFSSMHIFRVFHPSRESEEPFCSETFHGRLLRISHETFHENNVS